MNPARKTSTPTILSGASPPDDLRVDFDDRTRHGHVRHPRDAGIDCLRKAATRPAHLEIGVAGERPHTLRQLVDRGRVDELHRVAERDAERDRKDRERDAHPVLRERAAHRGQIRNKATSASGRGGGQERGPTSDPTPMPPTPTCAVRRA